MANNTNLKHCVKKRKTVIYNYSIFVSFKKIQNSARVIEITESKMVAEIRAKGHEETYFFKNRFLLILGEERNIDRLPLAHFLLKSETWT